MLQVTVNNIHISSHHVHTVKPDLTTTCEQQPPVDNGQFESSTTSLNLSFIRHLCQTAAFFWSQGWPLYTGLTVYKVYFCTVYRMLSEYWMVKKKCKCKVAQI